MRAKNFIALMLFYVFGLTGYSFNYSSELTSFAVDLESKDNKIVIRNKALPSGTTMTFYNSSKYEAYNLYKVIVLFFWKMPNFEEVIINYETPNNKRKILKARKKIVEEIIGGPIDSFSKEEIGNIRYNKKQAKKAFLSYKFIME